MPVKFWEYGGDSAHDEFLGWLERNEGAYFLNCKSQSSVMLHRWPCSHFLPLEGWKPDTLTIAPKVCSKSADALREWAKEHYERPLAECSHCL